MSLNICHDIIVLYVIDIQFNLIICIISLNNITQAKGNNTPDSKPQIKVTFF